MSGNLTQEDYEELVPSWRAVIARHGKMCLLFVMHDFHRWEPHAAWDDLRFDLKQAAQVDRIAMVGERMAGPDDEDCIWFVEADVRYFDSSRRAEAEQWVRAS